MGGFFSFSLRMEVLNKAENKKTIEKLKNSNGGGEGQRDGRCEGLNICFACRRPGLRPWHCMVPWLTPGPTVKHTVGAASRFYEVWPLKTKQNIHRAREITQQADYMRFRKDKVQSPKPQVPLTTTGEVVRSTELGVAPDDHQVWPPKLKRTTTMPVSPI